MPGSRSISRLRSHAALALAAIALAPAPLSAAAGGLVTDRVVIVMRHGVRPPTKDPPMPAGTAAQPWPSWSVPPGHLTVHGAKAIALLGDYDRRWLANRGLVPRSGCPAVSVIADSDQRTIATAEHWAAAVAPRCKVAIVHKPQGTPDPTFSAIDEGGAQLDPDRAIREIREAMKGQTPQSLERRYRPLLGRIDRVLCGAKSKGCGVSHTPTTLEPATAGDKPHFAGALDDASSAGQILLLEYTDGKPMREVGWGRASARDVADLSEFHALEYRILPRVRYIAATNLKLLLPHVREALSTRADGPKVLMISGHDTTVANLAGLLDAHWKAPGAAADDPVPGGGIVIEALHDRSGRYVRAYYRSQSLDQMRALTRLTAGNVYWTPIALPGCSSRGIRGLCTAQQFDRLLRD